ncbi:DUF1810 domain-containing protein [Terriglobus aquaticus]|uniref:DUF1810 domain-containing protein n=1 Tax=Terriglobus aquaticus TaxID=940139 RepID=A0ABW9KFN0_9BACT|nr:DUF1810 domain-containing protein [Terriglobus aquaticus]
MAIGFDLERFVEAQRGAYEQALREMEAGAKRSHWMWFIFPQVRGLGSSSMAQRYAIAGRDEAAAYLQHPVLGGRLREITAAVNRIKGRSLDEVFGYPDDLKFHSSMTLFAEAEGTDGIVFAQALQTWFGGRRDEATLRMLGSRRNE